MKLYFKLLIMTCGLFLGGISTAADDTSNDTSSDISNDISNLVSFTTNLSAFTANFEQIVYDTDLQPVQSSTGDVTLKRPGKFVWNYTSPTPQSIIADGQKIWMYDEELEQVTVSSINERASGTPLALLMGSAPLDQEFDVKALGLSEGIEWFELRPKTNESDFETVYLGLNDTGLAMMDLRDSFGQSTQIRFIDFNDKANIDDSLFEFVPPEGVDVLGQL